MKRLFSGILLILLLICIVASTFRIQPAEAIGTIYIRADGSVNPSDAPIQRNGDTYTLTDNISTSALYGILIQRNNMTLDGGGYMLQGLVASAGHVGIVLEGIGNVTIRNMRIEAWSGGILLSSSCNNTLSGNNITANDGYGICLFSSSNNNSISGNNVTNNDSTGIELSSSSNNNSIFGNKIANNYYGIYCVNFASNNRISGNNITNNNAGVYLHYSSDNTFSGNNITVNGQVGITIYFSSINNSISGNNIANNPIGVFLYSSPSNNSICGNNITANNIGVYYWSSSNNRIFHNNFVNNTNQVLNYNSTNVWDDGYPSGGNCWSDYSGTDIYRGVFQNVTGSDGIGDTSYIIYANITDRYPLMGFFGSVTEAGENVTAFPADDVGLIFENVATEGSTTLNKTSSGPAPPSGFKLLGQYYDIKTTAVYSGKIKIRITYNGSSITSQQEATLQLLHWNETSHSWNDITTYVDKENNVIYGETDSFSIFGVTSAALTGDVNGDLKVDGKDIAIVARAYDTRPGDLKWDSRADINGDSKVDGKDIAIVAKHYDTHYP